MVDRLPAELADALLLAIVDSNPAMTAHAFSSQAAADEVAMKVARIWTALRAAAPLEEGMPTEPPSPPAAA